MQPQRNGEPSRLPFAGRHLVLTACTMCRSAADAELRQTSKTQIGYFKNKSPGCSERWRTCLLRPKPTGVIVRSLEAFTTSFTKMFLE